jgi:diguanylate cyclase
MADTTQLNQLQTRILRLSEQAMQAMTRRNIAVTPENYTLFFGYVSKQPVALTDEIDAIERKAGTLDAPVLQALYARYMSDPMMRARIFTGTGEQVDDVMDHLFSSLGKLQDVNSHLVQDLLQNITDLHQESSVSELKNMLEASLETMMQIKSSGDAMACELHDAQEEIKLLRQDLAEQIEASERDFLTHAYNRKAWEKRADKALEEAAQESSTLCVALLDIDRFKLINDNYGHAVGDLVLKYSVELLKDSIKGRDIVARYGGEEFVLLLPNTPLKGALAVLENIRLVMAERLVSILPVMPGISEIQTITASIGVAEFSGSKTTLAALLKQADDALYAAKNAGRNQVSH